MNTSMNQGEQSSRNDYSNQNNSSMGGTNNEPNFESENRNRQHSDNVGAGEHSYQDETEYGKTREHESGMDKIERKADEMKDKVNQGYEKTRDKVNEWGDKAENKMNEWGDKSSSKLEDADRKMDKAEKKMDKAQDKFAKGYENDGERKMEKAEKKMDKAQDKVNDANENRNERNEYGSSQSSTFGNQSNMSNAHDYEARQGNISGTENPSKDNARDYENKNTTQR